MKQRTSLITGLACLMASATLGLTCLSGCASTTPTAFEQTVYDIKTNWVPVLVVKTNVVTITNTVVQSVTVTNTQGVLVPTYVTNIVTLPTYQTVLVTNLMPEYERTVKADIAQTGAAVGGVVDAFVPGVGAAVTQGILAALGLFAYWRQRKNRSASAVLAQEIETVREFVKALPNGASYDAALTKFMAEHQAEAGVMTQVASLLQQMVSNADAKVAAQEVITTINALKSTTTPIAPVSPGS